jgi:hypothetical protein
VFLLILVLLQLAVFHKLFVLWIHVESRKVCCVVMCQMLHDITIDNVRETGLFEDWYYAGSSQICWNCSCVRGCLVYMDKFWCYDISYFSLLGSVVRLSQVLLLYVSWVLRVIYGRLYKISCSVFWLLCFVSFPISFVCPVHASSGFCCYPW